MHADVHSVSKKKQPRVITTDEDYFMAACFFVSFRSRDPELQQGAVIVNSRNKKISEGYNRLTEPILDSDISWKSPEKDLMCMHPEQDAIDSFTGHHSELDGAVIYTTSKPCSECVKRIIRKKIRKIIFGHLPNPIVTHVDWQVTKELAKHSRITLEKYHGNLNWLYDRLTLFRINYPEIF